MSSEMAGKQSDALNGVQVERVKSALYWSAFLCFVLGDITGAVVNTMFF